MIASFFNGNALNTVDLKNRVSVPAGYRDTVAKRAGDNCLLVGPSDRGTCLVGYDTQRSARLFAQLEARFAGDFSEARDMAFQDAFAGIETLGLDDNGRIVLPLELKKTVGIDKHALFIGMADYFQIWNPDAFIAFRGPDSAIGRLAAGLMAARK